MGDCKHFQAKQRCSSCDFLRKSVCPFNGFECEYVQCCDAVFELWLIRNGVVRYDADKISCFRDLRGRA